MMTIKDRLEKIQKENKIKPGLNDSEFAKSIGTYPGKIAEIKSGKVKTISGELALEISKIYNIKIEWILTGEGNMFEDSLKDYVFIPERGEVDCSAGQGCEVLYEEPTGYFPFKRSELKKMGANITQCDFIKVKGESMYPHLSTGDKILVDKSQTEIIEGKVYVVWFEGMLFVKRIRTVREGFLSLISDNPAFPQIPIDLEKDKDKFKICGRVLWNLIDLSIK